MRKVALAVTLGAAAACGSSATGSGAQTATGDAGGQPGASPTAVMSSAGASARAFRDLVQRGNSNPYRVTYRVSSSAGTQAVSSPQTWYVSGPRFRMDLAGSAGAQNSDLLSYFVVPEGTFGCVSRAGSAAQCSGVAVAQAYAQSPGAAFDAQLRANPDGYGATFSGTRQLAGTSASCYAVSGTSSGFTQATVCYSTGGVPLLYQLDAAGLTVTMEATSFGVSTDADFALPGPMQQLPGVPAPTRP